MRAILALEDGFILEGVSFTGPIELTGGEVIFNTTMIGYQELITDPASAGQLLCITYPVIGSYGINPEDMESGKAQVAALIVKECCKEPSNWRSTETLPEFLIRCGVPGIEGVDTRALALHIREHGTMRACISTSLSAEELVAKAKALPAIEGQSAVPAVTCAAPERWNGEAREAFTGWAEGKAKVAVYDFGVKNSQLKFLAEQGMDMCIVPASFTAEQVKATGAEAVFLSSGPGDPAALKDVIAEVAKLAETMPMAGVGLGHQLLILALGGTSSKMKVGHHGANYPTRKTATGNVVITAQNCGFSVTAPEGVEEAFV
ncbi:MAG: glutamine-hydrolyzing carbamoyl-phosphate synthase small subunit, partial [Mailhella sp.]|nr:glutamine-hydrolyzing carbamoyl-phosphate synthase small subunit [Mailhella sp.]